MDPVTRINRDPKFYIVIIADDFMDFSSRRLRG
jgi:hypothetical protein